MSFSFVLTIEVSDLIYNNRAGKSSSIFKEFDAINCFCGSCAAATKSEVDVILIGDIVNFAGFEVITGCGNHETRVWGAMELNKVLALLNPKLRIGKELDRKSTRLNSSHLKLSRMPSSA